jgi:mitochondrial intermediate peptidase
LNLKALLGRKSGLVKNRLLDSPAGYAVFARRNVDKAEKLYAKIMSSSSVEDWTQVVRRLDRMSDLLCRVLDLCDFVRLVHPDEWHQQAAGAAWDQVYEYMNRLNTQPDLYEQLCKVLRMPEVTSAWCEEERMVAETLKVDFEKSAVHLADSNRKRFIDLSQKISQAGSYYLDAMAPEQPWLDVSPDKLGGLDPVHKLTRSRKNRLFVRDGSMGTGLAMMRDAEWRRRAYLALNTASSSTINVLEKMLHYRAELARITGFESYAHQNLKDRMMAKSPAAVEKFLMALQKRNSPVARRCIETLTTAKRHDLKDSQAALAPWDIAFYKSWIKRHDSPLAGALPHFSVGRVIQGLSALFERLYGIRFAYRETEPGEVWNSEVRRLDVLDERNRVIAVLYCDLFARPGKSPNAAHYTLRCSRELAAEELEEAGAEDLGGALPFGSAMEAATDGMETLTEEGRIMQVPTIALVCSFDHTPRGREADVGLDHSQVVTLFHEMGHAVHSFLARTRFQNVAGTRCATDLAEVPSTFMEHFATNPAVLNLFTPPGANGPSAIQADRLEAHMARRKRFEGLETERQIVLALLDQECHSPAVGTPGFSSTRTYLDIQHRLGVACPDDPATSWQGFFGHLYGYGSTYYSYLFDKVLADRIWQAVFDAGRDDAALSREKGEWVKEKLLRWGGSRDPWVCMADVLRDDRIAEGGEKAMAIVGSWGAKE